MGRKAAENRRKHGVSFEKVRTEFLDEDALQIPDPEHSEEEDRFIMLGVSLHLRLIVVCHCYRRSHEVIRLISALKADLNERSQYDDRRAR